MHPNQTGGIVQIMDHEWLPLTAEELRKQAQTCRRLASCVIDPDLIRRLEDQAAELLSQAELKSPAGTGASTVIHSEALQGPGPC